MRKTIQGQLPYEKRESIGPVSINGAWELPAPCVCVYVCVQEQATQPSLTLPPTGLLFTSSHRKREARAAGSVVGRTQAPRTPNKPDILLGGRGGLRGCLLGVGSEGDSEVSKSPPCPAPEMDKPR